MGVREAWTWSRTDGARIRVAGAAAGAFTVADPSRVPPGLDRKALDRLPASRTPPEASRHARGIARRVTHAQAGADDTEPTGRR